MSNTKSDIHLNDTSLSNCLGEAIYLLFRERIFTYSRIVSKTLVHGSVVVIHTAGSLDYLDKDLLFSKKCKNWQ